MKKEKPVVNEKVTPEKKSPRIKNEKLNADEQFPIVGIGASAGGYHAGTASAVYLYESFSCNRPFKG